MVISVGECLLRTSAMRCCAVFFMGSSFSDLENLLIPFLDNFRVAPNDNLYNTVEVLAFCNPTPLCFVDDTRYPAS